LLYKGKYLYEISIDSLPFQFVKVIHY